MKPKPALRLVRLDTVTMTDAVKVARAQVWTMLMGTDAKTGTSDRHGQPERAT